eukprot:9472578-Pyramimonas_sp.AAC.1
MSSGPRPSPRPPGPQATRLRALERKNKKHSTGALALVGLSDPGSRRGPRHLPWSLGPLDQDP